MELPDQPTFASGVYYREPKAALAWLERAFGFETTMAIDGPDDGRVMIGGEWTDAVRSPASVGGVNTQGVHVDVGTDIDGHCEHARSAGAVIVMEPEDQFYGDRTYRAVDLEGHVWTFSMHVLDVTKAEAEAAIGMPITATNWA